MSSSSFDLSKPEEHLSRCHLFTVDDVHLAVTLCSGERLETLLHDVEPSLLDTDRESCSAGGVSSGTK